MRRIALRSAGARKRAFDCVCYEPQGPTRPGEYCWVVDRPPPPKFCMLQGRWLAKAGFGTP
eukprot:6460165-Alexandrium_andersonii.AAC.1